MQFRLPGTPGISRAPGAMESGGDGGEGAVRALLASYNAALNSGDLAAVMPLYTEDGVFMAPFGPSAIGRDEVRAAYEGVFRELAFDVRFDVAEVVTMGSGWAFARTNSAGSTVHAATGGTTSEANQELFVLRAGADGRWRIARYSFSPTSAPRSHA